MSLFLAKRFLTFVATLFGATIVTFLALEILPGDPALVILGINAPESAVEALHIKLGLDRPPLERYLEWVGDLAQGRFGESYTYGVSVDELLRARLTITLPLAFMSMVLSVAAALVLGLFAASRHNRAGDLSVMGFSQLGISVPNFWLALLLVLFFAVNLRWFSAGGFPGWDESVWRSIKALILPAIALATVQGAILARFTRSAVLETMREDYVRTARAKGLTRRATLWRHVLRNAMIPVVTILALSFGTLFSGALITETMFSYLGMGKLIYDSILGNDFNLALICLLFATLVTLLANLAADFLGEARGS